MFFAGNYSISNSNVNTNNVSVDVSHLFFALILRAGFITVQVGSIPTENISCILLENIVDVAVSLMSFGFLGFIFAFGDKSNFGFIGYGTFFNSNSKYKKKLILGYTACIIGSSLKTTLLSARLHFFAHILSSFLYSAICQSVLMHWFWHENGWTQVSLVNRKPFLNFQDSGADLIIHVSSSIAGLVGCIFLGRRLLKLTEIDASSVGIESSGNSLFGYFLVIIGLVSFNFLPKNEVNYDSTVIAFNSLTALSIGFFVVALLHYFTFRDNFNHWTILRCSQGAVASLVIIANGVETYSTLSNSLIALAGSVIYYYSMLAVYNTSLEDYCNVFSIHFVCGILGFLMPALMSHYESGQWKFMLFMSNCIIVIVIILFISSTFSALFFLLNLIGCLRNQYEKVSHKRSENAKSYIRTKGFLKRMFQDSDFFIEPGSFQEKFITNE